MAEKDKRDNLIYTKEKECIMITILPNSIPDNRPLTSQETEAANAIFDFINKCFERIGIGIGPADLQVVKHQSLGVPMFCPRLQNPDYPCDIIYICIDLFTRWNQFIFQASHEFTHCVIHRLNNQEDQKALWIEETICEAMSLVFLNIFANNWGGCALSKESQPYYASIQKYLRGELEKIGNHRLEQCYGIKELQEINRTSEGQREDRCEEMHQLYRLIQSADDIRGLVHYRNFVVPGTILLDTQMYQKAYPSSQAVQYLCCLQDNTLRRDVTASKVSEKS